MRRSLGLVLFGALASIGCSAEEACGDDHQGTAVESSSRSGDGVLTSAGDSVSRLYRVALTGLPELWQPDSAIIVGRLNGGLTLAYTSGAPGSDGVTQMPQLGMTVSDADVDPPTPPPGTPSYPSSQPLAFGSFLFEECWEGGPPVCCPFGSTSCEGLLKVTIQRLDGEPFPPVEVNFNVSASAVVSRCPTNRGNPELVLEEEAAP